MVNDVDGRQEAEMVPYEGCGGSKSASRLTNRITTGKLIRKLSSRMRCERRRGGSTRRHPAAPARGGVSVMVLPVMTPLVSNVFEAQARPIDWKFSRRERVRGR